MDKTILEQAKEYLVEKKYSVIPVGPDKRPLISWKEYQTRRASVEELEKWWTEYPEAQVGIVTGKISNLTVVDIEKGGDASFLPQETYIVRTGGGGWHYYFTYADGIMNKARVRELVDIRSEGGYVVAPPSVSEKGEYCVFQESEMLPFPRYLFPDEMKKWPEDDQFRGVKSTETLDYPGYGPGQRNDQMTRFIGHVLRKIHPALWDTEGVKIIRDANQKNTPPLSANELAASYKSIRSREIVASASRPQYAPTQQPAPVYPDDGSDEVLHLAEVARRQQITMDRVYPLGMPCFDEPLMGGTMPGDLICIAGSTGNGKTTLMQDFAVSLMLGAKPQKILIFSYEVLPQFIWKKFQEMGVTENDPVYIPLKHTGGSVDWIEKKIMEARQKYEIGAVFIDHMGFLAPRHAISNNKILAGNLSMYITQIARDLKMLAIREEIPIIVPVHLRKTDEPSLNDIAHSGGPAQESDAVFMIERERAPKDANSYYTDSTKITLIKNRRTGISVVAWFKMMNGRFVFDNVRNAQEDLMRGEDKPKTVATRAVEVKQPEPKEEKEEDALVDDLFEALTREAEAEKRSEPF